MAEERATPPERGVNGPRRLRFIIGAVVVAALVAVGALVALGGGGGDSDGVASDTGSSTTGDTSGSSGVGGAGSADDGATSDDGSSSDDGSASDDGSSSDDGGPWLGIGSTTLPEPMPVEPPEETALLGSNNEEAATAVRAYFEATGADLTGLGVFVFPVADVGESLLVFDADVDAMAELGGDGGDEVFAELQNLPELRDGNVTRVVVNLRGTDAEGPYLITLTLPIDALDPNNPKYLDLTEEEQAEFRKVEVRR